MGEALPMAMGAREGGIAIALLAFAVCVAAMDVSVLDSEDAGVELGQAKVSTGNAIQAAVAGAVNKVVKKAVKKSVKKAKVQAREQTNAATKGAVKDAIA